MGHRVGHCLLGYNRHVRETQDSGGQPDPGQGGGHDGGLHEGRLQLQPGEVALDERVVTRQCSREDRRYDGSHWLPGTRVKLHVAQQTIRRGGRVS